MIFIRKAAFASCLLFALAATLFAAPAFGNLLRRSGT